MKLKASIGFQAIALVLVCMTSLRMGVAERRSYRAMPRSLPVVANTSGSAGLKRTAGWEGKGRPWEGMVRGTARGGKHAEFSKVETHCKV